MAASMTFAYAIAFGILRCGRPTQKISGTALGCSRARWWSLLYDRCMATFGVHRVGGRRGMVERWWCWPARSWLPRSRNNASAFAKSKSSITSVLRGRSASGNWRLVLRHALRNALLPVVVLFSVEMPTALGGAFVVERASGDRGLGEETARAVQAHDVAWLVGLAFVTAIAVTLTSIASNWLSPDCIPDFAKRRFAPP